MDGNQPGMRVRENYKISSSRKFIGKMMKDSNVNSPRAFGSAYLDTDKLVELKKKLHEQNHNVSMTALFTKLLAETLKMQPLLNSALLNEEDFYIYDSVNVAVGVGMEDTVMTLVIKEAQDKSIFEIADELKEGISLLKAKKLSFDRMSGGTVTLSSLGMFGVEQFCPMVTPPQSMIVGIGATKRNLVVNDDDTTRIANQTCVSVCINHCALDGMHGGIFLQAFRDIVENPEAHLGL